jgi:hypothetical protein
MFHVFVLWNFFNAGFWKRVEDVELTLKGFWWSATGKNNPRRRRCGGGPWDCWRSQQLCWSVSHSFVLSLFFSLALPTLSLPASLCLCRLISLIINSPHGRPRQLGTKFFLWVSYRPLSPSFDPSTILFFFISETWLSSHNFSIVLCMSGKHHTDPVLYSDYRRFVYSPFRISFVHMHFRSYTFFFAHVDCCN